jgi:serine/threonine-protein kinase
MPTQQNIGGFRILGMLGRGGMGVVHRALQVSMGREVALKVLDERIARDPRLSDRFLREARIAARVNHPHVVTVYDGGRDGDLLFLAMELMSGGDADRLRVAAGGALPPRRALEIIRDGARGLAALHAVGLLHRDIKPANIFINADGAAKLADLGLSRPVEAGRDQLTSASDLHGTPAFMSPEQAQGGALDIRSDIYALGASLYCLIAGHPPYRGDTAMAVAIKAATGPFPDPATVPGMPAAVAALIRTATALDPAARHADPAALVTACDQVLGRLPAGVSGAAASSATESEPTTRSRVQWGIPIAAAVIIVIAAMVWALRPSSPPLPAQVQDSSTTVTAPAASGPSASAASPAQVDLVGDWKVTNGTGWAGILSCFADGTCRLGENTGTYAMKDGVVVFTYHDGHVDRITAWSGGTGSGDNSHGEKLTFSKQP